MKKIIYLIIAIALASCEKVEDSPIGRPSSVKSLGITSADYLAIGQRDLKSSNDDWTNLYNLTIEGSKLKSEKVGFFDDNGEIIDSIFTTIQIDNIYSISDNFICLVGSFEIQIDSTFDKLEYSSLLVNKLTGDIYDFDGHYPENSSYYLGNVFLQQDLNENLYYTYQSAVYKLNISGTQISYETYVSNSQYQSDYFYISPGSNCFFYGYPKTKIKTPTDGIILADRYLKNLFTCNGEIFAALNNDFAKISLTNNECSTTIINSIKTPIEIYKYFYENGSYAFLMGDMSEFVELGIVGFVFDDVNDKIMDLSIPENMENEQYRVQAYSKGNLWISSENNVNKEFYVFDINEFDIKTPYPQYEPGVEVAILNSYDLFQFPENIEVYTFAIIGDEIAFTGYDLTNENDISGILTSDDLIINEVTSDFQFEILHGLN